MWCVVVGMFSVGCDAFGCCFGILVCFAFVVVTIIMRGCMSWLVLVGMIVMFFKLPGVGV